MFTPISNEILVNSTIGGQTSNSHTTFFADGSYITVWQAPFEPNGFQGIYAQRFSANGTPVGHQIKVDNDQASSSDINPQVLALDDGSYVVVWEGSGAGDNSGIFARKFDANDQAIGDEILVNTTTNSNQRNPTLALLSNGEIGVAWTTNAAPEGFAIVMQRFDVLLNTLGNETTVVDLDTQSGVTPRIEVQNNGFMIVAHDINSANANGAFAQRFNNDLTQNGAQIDVAVQATGSQRIPEIDFFDDGSYVITWQEDNSLDGSNSGIYAQLFDANDNATSGAFLVNTSTVINQSNPDVSVLQDGTFVIAWNGYFTPNGENTYGIVYQQFSSDGTALGLETLATSPDNSNSSQSNPQIEALDNNGFVLTWTSTRFLDDGVRVNGIVQRVFADENAAAVNQAPQIVGFTNQVSFQENDLNAAPQIIDLAVAIVDQDTANYEGGSFSASFIENGGNEDNLSIRNIGSGSNEIGVQGNQISYEGIAIGTIVSNGEDGSDLEIDLLAGATIEAMEALLENLQYQNTSQSPTLERTLSIRLQDADGNSNTNTITQIEVIPDNDSVPASGESTVVNTFTNSFQQNPDIASFDDGSYVVVWQSYNQNDVNNYGIHAQRYSNDGTPVGVEMQINQSDNLPIDGAQTQPTVATFSDGSFMIAWQGPGEFGDHASGIYGRIFNADGTPAGDDFRLNENPVGSLADVDLVRLSDGNIAATWNGSSIDSNSTGIASRVFDSTGTALTGDIVVNSTAVNVQRFPSIDAYDGGYVIAWSSFQQTGGASGDIVARQINNDGTFASDEIDITLGQAGTQDSPQVVAYDDGSFVLVWTDTSAQDSSRDGVFARRFDANGNALTEQIQVNEFAVNDQNQAQAVLLDNGNIAVTWSNFGQNFIMRREFTSDLRAIDSELQVESSSSFNVAAPNIANIGNNEYVVVFQATGSGLNSTDVLLNRFGSFNEQQNPIIGGFNDEYTFTEAEVNAGFVQIDLGVSLVDTDSANFENAELFVNYNAGGNQDDQLQITSQGNGAGQVNVSGTDVFFEGTQIGSISQNGLNGQALVVQFNAQASAQAVESVLESLAYANTSNSPEQSRSVSVRLTDGDGGASQNLQFNINLELENDSTPLTLASAQVNTFFEDQQYNARGQAFDDGSYIIVWQSESQNNLNNISSIHGQKFNAQGQAIGNEFSISAYEASSANISDIEPNVVTFSDGTFIVAWTGDGNDDSTDIVAQRFNADGTMNGGEFQLNQTNSSQADIQLARLSDGNFIASWNSNNVDGSSLGVVGRIYQADGTALTDEFTVNTSTSSVQYRPDVTAYDGGFTIAWESLGQTGFSNYQTVLQRFNNDGSTVGNEVQISNDNNLGAQQNVAIASQADGSLIAVWQSSSAITDGSGSAIVAQRYDAAGNTIGDIFVVNELASGNQTFPDIAFLPTGNFVVTWDDGGQIERREFDNNALPIDGDQLVNVGEESSTQTTPSLIMLENGSYAIVFRSSASTDGDTWGTFQSLYGAPATSDNPLLAGLEENVVFAEADVNNAPQLIDIAVAISDTDSSNFEGGRLSAGYIQNGSEDDQLSVNDQGTGNGQIGVNGSQISYSGIVIGNIEQDGQNGSSLVISFTADATQEAVEALVQNLSYANNSQAPREERILAINIEDGDGGSTGNQAVTIQITSELDSSPSVFGPEQVNTYTASTQNSAAVDSFADGSYVITWASVSQDDSGMAVLMQRYDANGVAIGRETFVAQTTDNDQNDPKVTVLNDGTYIVAWEGFGVTDSGGVFARRFDANGNAISDEFTLRDTNNSSEQLVSISALSDGNFVATWSASSFGGNSWEIVGRVFNPDGTAIADSFSVNTTTSGFQYRPEVTSHDTGFIVSWYSNGQTNGNNNDIVARQFNNDGSAASGEINVFLGEGSQTLSSVAAYADGRFVVVYAATDGNNEGVYAQRYDASGLALGDRILVNESVISTQTDPSVTILANGNFVVSYNGQGIGGDSNDAYVREFDSDGIPLDGEILVSTTSASTTSEVVLSQLGNTNNYVVVYNESNIENSGSGVGVFQNIFGNPADFSRSGQIILDDVATVRTLLNTQSSTPVRIDADIDLSTSGTVDFDGGMVEAYYLTPSDFDDTFGIESSGTGAGQIEVNGSDVLFNGIQIGSIDTTENGSAGTALSIALNSNATTEGVQTLIEHITYSSQNNVLNNETIALRVTDGNGVTTNRAVNINIASSVPAPFFLIEDVGREVNFDQSDVVGQLSPLDTNINFEYNGTNSLEGGRLTLTYISGSATFNDTLGVTSSGTGNNQISVNGDQILYEGTAFATIDSALNGEQGNNLSINFNAGTTEEAVEALIEAVSYGTNFGLFNDRSLRLYVIDSANVFSTNIDYRVSITPEANSAQLIEAPTLVNQYTPASQTLPAADGLANGGYVVAWESQDQDGDGNGIFAQIFNEQGQATGNQFIVNTENFSTQNQPSVVGLSDGTFVVSWTSRIDESNSDINIYAQRFSATGEMLGGQFILNERMSSTQFESKLEALPGGGFVAVYTTNDSSLGDNSGSGIAMRYFDNNGVATTAEIRVNENIAGSQTDPSVAVTDSAVMVSWKTATGDDIQARIFNPVDGTELVSEFKVNTTESGDIWEEPTLTALDDGSFLVVWGQRITDFGGNFWGFRGQKVGSDGALIGSEFVINSEETTWTSSDGAEVVTLNNGNVVVSWGAGAGVYTQEIDVTPDTPVLAGSPVLAGNGPSTDHQQALVEVGANSAALIWSGFNTATPTNSTYEIVQQLIGDPADFTFQANPSIENLPEQITIMESRAEQLLFSAIDILDTDSANFEGGSLFLDAIAGYLDNQNTDEAFAADNWGIQSTGTGQGQISVSGNQVLFEGILIGTISSDGVAGNGLQVDFTANATPAAVTALVQSITFASSSTSPLTTREIALRISDGDGGANIGQSFTLNVTPVIDGFAPQTDIFQVNSYEVGGQGSPAMAELSDGSYIVAWTSDTSQDGDGAGIFAQRYGANGAPIGNEININSTTMSNQTIAQVVANNDGFLVVWQSTGSVDGSGTGIIAQRFDNLGEPVGDEFIVNQTTSSTQADPAAVELANGGFAVVWEGNGNQVNNNDSGGIFLRLYDTDGVSVSSEILVSTTNTAFNQTDPSVAQLSDGKLAVAYTENGNTVNVQLLNADGTAADASFTVPGTTSSETAPSITALNGGGFVVTYTNGNDGSSSGILAQIYDNDGALVGDQFRVNEGTSSSQYEPQVSALATGGFVITFSDTGAGNRIFSQEYSATGELLDGNFQVNEVFSTSFQPAVLGLSAGGYAVSWSQFSNETEVSNTYGVFSRLFGADGQFTADIGGLELAGLEEQITVQESDTPSNLFASVDLFDADSNSFDGGSLTLSVIEGYGSSAQFIDSETQDNFSIENQGTGSGQISLNGNTVSYQGLAIGTVIKTGESGQELQIDFNAAASQDAISALIQAITYVNSSQGPADERTISLRLSDGAGATTANNAITLNVTPEIDGASPQGDSIQVNAFTDGAQVLPQVAELEDGSFVVVWQSIDQDGWSNGIVAQRFDATGSPIGNEFVVNQYTPTAQEMPNVAAINGGFVVTWDGRGENDSSGVFARSFDLNGVATSNDFRLSDTINGRQENTDVTALSSGGFAAVFAGSGAGDSSGVFLRIFDENNNPVSAELLVNTEVSPTNQWPSVTQLANGNIVVSWEESSNIKAQIFSPDGTRLSVSDFVVADSIDTETDSSVAALTGGGFVVTYTDFDDGSNYGVFAQRFDDSGAAVGDLFRVNETTSSFQYRSEVTGTEDGGFAVTFYDAATRQVFVQQYDANGAIIDSPIAVDSSATNNEFDSSITSLSAGGFVVAYNNSNAESDGNNSNGIFMRLFGADGQFDTSAAPLLEIAQNTIEFSETSLNFAPQTLIVGAGVADADSSDFDGGRLEVSRTSSYGQGDQLGRQGFFPQDNLGIANQGVGAGEIGVAGSNVLYSGVVIGVIESSGANDTPLVVAFNADANAQAIESLIEAITYRNISDAPEASRSYSLRLTDGDGGASLAQQIDVNIRQNLDGNLPTLQPERIVNSEPAGDQQFSQSSAIYDETTGDLAGYVVVWENITTNEVNLQIYDADNNPVGTETLLSSTTSNDQERPTVQALNNGTFVVSWYANNEDGSADGVVARIFNNDGTLDASAPHGGVQFIVNEFTSNNQRYPDIAVLSNGEFAVVWESSDSSNGDNNGFGISMQRFTEDGQAIGSETVINTTILGSQALPEVSALSSSTALPDGGYIVTWQSPDANSTGIYAQVVDAEGVPVGTEFPVNSTTQGTQDQVAVAGLNNGDFVITWEDNGADLGSLGVYAQRFTFDTNGTPVAIGPEFRVNSEYVGNQYDPEIAALSTGGFAISYTGNDSASLGVFVQEFDSAGRLVDLPQLVNQNESSSQQLSHISATNDGGYIVTWTTFEDNTARNEIALQRFGNLRPDITDFVVQGIEDETTSIDINEFINAFNDPENEALQAVSFITPPISGVLQFNGVDVTPGQIINVVDLLSGELNYIGDPDFNGVDSFTWSGSDGVSFAEPATTNISILPVNDAPGMDVGSDDVGIEAFSPFNSFTHVITFADPDGDVLLVDVDWGDGTPIQRYTTSSDTLNTAHRYLDDGVYTVSVTVDDQSGSANAVETQTYQATINNAAPTMGLSGSNTVEQGEVYTLTLGNPSDPGDDTVTDFIVDWGDGTVETFNSPGQVTHTYASSGDYSISVDLTDEDDTYIDVVSKTVQVSEPAEVLDIAPINDTTADEGSVFFQEINFTDPTDSGGNGWTYDIDWGDGTIQTGVRVFQRDFNVAHTFADDGAYDVQITVRDDQGSQVDTEDFQVVVGDVAPRLNLSGAGSVLEGSIYFLTGSVVDPGDDTITEFTIDWGDGTVETIAGPDFGTQQHLYADGPFGYDITVTATNEDVTDVEVGTRFVNILNVAPTSSITGPTELDEGTEYTFTFGDITDPGDDTITATVIDWGDGTTTEYTGAGDYTHTFTDGDATRAIQLLVTDEDAAPHSAASLVVDVNDVDPSLTISGASQVDEGSTYSLTLSDLIEPGDDPINEIRIDWGDGSAIEVVSVLGTYEHVFADGDDDVTINVSLVNDDDVFDVGTIDVAINNVAPELPITGAPTAVQGETYTLSLGDIFDPGEDFVSTDGIVVDWGDGETSVLSTVGDVSHVYTTLGDFNISVSITDEDGTFLDAANLTVTVEAPAETVNLASQVDETLNEGDTFTRTIDFTDEEDNGAPGRTVDIDWNDDGVIDESFTVDANATSFDISNVFADGDDVSTVAVTITDGIDETDTERFDVTIDNVAPVSSITGPTELDEGTQYTFSFGDITDPGLDTVSNAQIDWGDGQFSVYSGAGDYNHTFADGDEARTIRLLLTDEDGTFTAATLAVNVNDVAPSITLNGASEVDEGAVYTLTLSDLVDPGTDPVSEYIIDWGDGTQPQSVADLGDVTHVFADGESTSTISVTIVNDDGSFDGGSLTVDVNNVAPVAVIAGDATVQEGETYTLTLGDIFDPGTDTITSATITWGDGNETEYTGAGDYTHVFSDGDANFTIELNVTDEDGDFVAASLAVNVTDVAPSLTLTGNDDVNEGSSYTLTLSDLVDPGDDTVTEYLIDWGDGTPVESVASLGDVSHVYADGDATHQISVSIVNDDGTFPGATKTVDINNVAPTVGLTGAATGIQNTPYTLALGAIIDPGLDTIVANGITVDWGDGTIQSYDSVGDIDHVYTSAGDFTINVSLEDEDGVFENVASQDVSISVPASTVDIVAQSDAVLNEGDTFTRTIDFTDEEDNGAPGRTVDIDWNDDGVIDESFTVDANATSFDISNVFADGDDVSTVAVTITDGIDETDTERFDVTIDNVAPVSSITGPTELDEGTQYTFSFGDITDPGLDTVSNAQIDWGDGQFSVYSGAGDYNHTFADGDEARTIRLLLTDEDGTFTAATLAVNVNDVAPSITLNGASEVDEGAVYTLTLSDLVDPGTDPVSEYIIDWGDGTQPQSVADLGDVTHVFADGESTSTISVTIVNDDGSFDGGSLTVDVNNVAPVAVIAGDATVQEGETYTLTLGDIFDPGTDTITSATITWGDGNETEYTGAGDYTHVFSDGDANFTIELNVTDEDGDFVAASLAVNVTDVAPSITITGESDVDEGSTYSLTLSDLIEPGDDPIDEILIDWGDGTPVEIVSDLGTFEHVFADGDDNVTISVSLANDDGLFEVGTLDVAVNNVAPDLPINGAPTAIQDEIYTLSLGDIIDPGEDFVVPNGIEVDWGDGTTSTFDTVGDVTHVYTSTGDFTISVNITDEDGTFLDAAILNITVEAAADTVTLASQTDETLNEGDTFTRTIDFTDEEDNGEAGRTVDIDWNDDGTVDESFTIDASATSFDISNVFADGNDVSTVAVTITDGEGESDTERFDITVDNVAPVTTIAGNSTVEEGETYTIILGDIVDPGLDTLSSATITWGDGSETEYTGAGDYSHVYSDGDASFTIELNVTDEDGDFIAASLSVDVTDVAPSLTLIGDDEVDEGASYTLTLADLVEPGDDAVSEYLIDWGDGTPVQSISDLGDVTHTYADGNASHQISVSIVNDDGAFPATSKTVTVNNVAPTLALTGAATGIQNTPYTLALGAIIDPGLDTIVANGITVDWGDGTIQNYDSVGDIQYSYSAIGNFTISISLEDEDGIFANVATQDVSIAAPAAGVDVAIQEDATISEGDTFTRTINFTDADDNDAPGRTVDIDWDGDGSIDQSFAIDASATSFDISNTFADGDDISTVAVTVTDTEGDSDTESFDVTVNNVAPTASIVADTRAIAGEEFSIDLGDIVDPGDESIASTVINWGDGTTTNYTGAGSYTHTYTGDVLDPIITFVVTDDDGTFVAAQADVVVEVQNTPPTATGTIDESILRGDQAQLVLDIDSQEAINEIIVDWGDGNIESFADASALLHNYDDTGLYDVSVQLVTDSGTYDVGIVDDVDVGFRVGDAPTYFNFFNPNQWQDAWTDVDLELSHRANTANDAESWSAMSFTGWVSWVLSGVDISFGNLGVSGISNYTGGSYQHLDGAEGIRADVDGAFSAQIDFSELFASELANSHESARIQAYANDGTLIDEYMVTGVDDGAATFSFSTNSAFDYVVISAGAYDQNGEFVYGSYAQNDGTATSSAPGTGSEFLLSAMQFGYRPDSAIDTQSIDQNSDEAIIANEAEFDFNDIDASNVNIDNKDNKYSATPIIGVVTAVEKSNEDTFLNADNFDFDFTETLITKADMTVEQLIYQKVSGSGNAIAISDTPNIKGIDIVDTDFMQLDDDPFDLTGFDDYLIKQASDIQYE